MENKIWEQGCIFIKKHMQFYSWQDFLKHKDEIIFYYNQLNFCWKELYRWYVFANVNISMIQKEKIWDIINNNNIL